MDISTQPALWGGLLRGYEGSFLTRSSVDLERATGEAHAANLVEAHLIETLSCLGRPKLDFYCVRVRCPLESPVVAGMLQALEQARQDGMLTFTGLVAEDEAATRAMLQTYDAFDTWVLRPGSSLVPLAQQRRAGVVIEGSGEQDVELDHVRIVTVAEASDLIEDARL